MIVAIIGNTIRSNLVTSLNWPIFIARSSLVVNKRIIGGWISGTKDIYEYAATAIAPNKSGANFVAK